MSDMREDWIHLNEISFVSVSLSVKVEFVWIYNVPPQILIVYMYVSVNREDYDRIHLLKISFVYACVFVSFRRKKMIYDWISFHKISFEYVCLSVNDCIYLHETVFCHFMCMFVSCGGKNMIGYTFSKYCLCTRVSLPDLGGRIGFMNGYPFTKSRLSTSMHFCLSVINFPGTKAPTSNVELVL